MREDESGAQMQKSAMTAAIALGLFVTPVAADEPDTLKRALATCAAIENTVERAECYDDLAGEVGVAEPKSTTSAVGLWTTREEVSPIDDSRSVYLYLDADEEVQISRYDRVTPTIVVRCFENTTSLYIVYGHFLGSDDTTVTYRIDDQDARAGTWWISTNHNSVGLWRGGQSIPLIRRLLDADQLVLRLTPYSENSVTVSFTVRGLTDVIGPLAKACHWSTEPPSAQSSKPDPVNVATPGTNVGAERPYNEAYGLLAQGDYVRAEAALRRFVEAFPAAPLTSNAQYWLGETLYIRGRFNEAAIAFAQGYQNYPQGAKAFDSLLKLGMSLAAMGKAQDACLTLWELQSKFPMAPSSIKRRADQEIARLRC